MQGTEWRCRGAVRGLRRAGEDFITQSFIDSDHIPGGQRSAQHPHQLPGTDPRACGAPQQPEHRSRAGTPRAGLPITQQPWRWQRGLPAPPCGAGITQTGLFFFRLAGRLLPPPWQITLVLQRGLRDPSWGSLPSQPTYPPQSSPTSRYGGQLLLCSPSVCRARCSQRTHPGDILLHIHMTIW